MTFLVQRSSTPWARKVTELARRWAGSGAFSPAALLAGVAAPITVKHSSNQYFMYAETKSPIMLPDLEPQPELLQMRGLEYAQRIESQGPGNYFYFTQPLAKLAPEHLATHAHDWASLVPDTPATRNPRGIKPYLSAWIGGSGSSTQAHYDVANNVFVQVHGLKRFHIYPPAATPAMHVFPDAHPRARKSQINFGNVDEELFPLVRDLPKPTVVDLGPGDVLSIPAFWYHTVEALTPSVSLNTFYESPVRIAADRVFQVAAPFDYSWGPSQMQQAIRAAAEAVSAGAGREDTAAFVREFLMSRYEVLYRRHPGQMEMSRSAHHMEDENARVDAQDIRDYCGDVYSPAFQALREAVQSEYSEWLGLGPVETHMQAIADIVLAHLIELWAVNLWRGLGVYPNLTACFIKSPR